MKLKLLFSLSLLMSFGVSAQLQTPSTKPPAVPPPSVQPQLGHMTAPVSMLPLVPGALPWDVLAKVKPQRLKDKVLPLYDKSVLALNNKPVKIQGFMMPLQPGDAQTHFLLTATSQTCNFCLPAGPEAMIEVKLPKAVRVTTEPIILSGKLLVLSDDPLGVYYRLAEATLSK